MGWEVKKLGDVCEFQNGQAHEMHIVEDGKYILINSKFISSEGEIYKTTDKQLSPLFEGDIVFVMSDVPNGKALAKCFLIDENDKYTLNQRICVIRSNSFDKKFLYYQLNRNKYLLSFNNGENQTNLRKNDILNCKLLVPPLPIQKKIVEILDSAFEKIEKAKENSEHNLQNANELFEKYLEQIFKNKGTGWEENQLNKLLNKTETINPTKLKDKEFDYIDVSSVNNQTFLIENTSKINSKNAPSRARKLVKKGDVIFATVRPTLKRIAIIEDKFDNQICSTGYFVLRTKEHILNKIIFYYLQSNSFISNMEQLQKGASYPAVTDHQIKIQSVNYPKSLEEQKAIVSKLDELSEQTKQLESIYSKKLDCLEELKQSILQKAFKGELTEALS